MCFITGSNALNESLVKTYFCGQLQNVMRMDAMMKFDILKSEKMDKKKKKLILDRRALIITHTMPGNPSAGTQSTYDNIIRNVFFGVDGSHDIVMASARKLNEECPFNKKALTCSLLTKKTNTGESPAPREVKLNYLVAVGALPAGK